MVIYWSYEDLVDKVVHQCSVAKSLFFPGHFKEFENFTLTFWPDSVVGVLLLEASLKQGVLLDSLKQGVRVHH